MQQPHPKVTPAHVEKIVHRDFPSDVVEQVWAILNEFGTERWHSEIDRVRLAILKLANGDVKELRRMMDAAKRDYRDVLASAEYPAWMGATPTLSVSKGDERERIIRSDWEQYKKWFSR
jgi:hypothetical protein